MKNNAISSVITAIILFLFSIFGAFFLLLAMNGYSSSEANMGLILFVIWTIFTILLFSAGSGIATRLITAKMEKANRWAIAAGATFISAILGSLSIAIGVFLGLAFAEISRSS